MNKKKRRRSYEVVYEKKKSGPECIERQWFSSRTHYYKHKDQVLKRIKKYHNNKLSLAQIKMLHELQQERLTDLCTGDITRFYNKNRLNYLN
jgi:DNA-binding transcriptional MerR regulator